MKAIVTGAAGFIGRNLCSRLLREKWNVLAIDDLSTGNRKNVLHNSFINYKFYDICGEQFHADVKEAKPDVIFHLAAIPRVSYSVEYPFLTTKQNLLGIMNVLDAVRKYSPKTRIVNSSSSSIYGDSSSLPTSENCIPDPQSPYAMQKLQGEEWGRMFATLYNIDIVSLRYFNVIGPFSRAAGSYSTVLSGWLYSIYGNSNEKAFLEGDGEQRRDFCDIENIINANLLAATRLTSFCGECFNIAQGESHSLLDCKQILEKISGQPLMLEKRPPRKGDVRHTWADISLAVDQLGYTPIVDFECQVSKMANWYKVEYLNKK